MDRVASAATRRDYHNPDQGHLAPNASYPYDAGGYQRQPRPYGPSPPTHASSSSNQSSGRHAEYVNTAEYRPADYDSDTYHSNKKPRLDQSGQHWPQYAASYPSHRQRPPGPPPAGYARSSSGLASGSSGSGAPPGQPAAYSSSASYHASRPDMQSSSFPSPPLISPINGSPYSRRESTLSGSAPGIPSPSSSHSSGRDNARPNKYSGHAQSQGQGSQYFSTAPPPHGAPPRGPPPSYGEAPSTGLAPHQKLPPMQVPDDADERARDSQYPYHGVPYSGGPRQFQFSQPYSTLWQQWATTLPSDFEDREAYCDSSGAIRRKRPASERARHEHSQAQHQDYQRQDHAAHYHQYEHSRERSYMQQLAQQQQQAEEEMHRQQQSMPRDPRHDPGYETYQHDEQRRQQYHDPKYDEQHRQQHYGPHHDEQHRQQYHDPNHDEQRRQQHHEHRDRPGDYHNHQYDEHGQYDPQHHYQYHQPHDHQHQFARTHHGEYAQEHRFENAGYVEGEDVMPGWEPEIKPPDITPEEEDESAEAGTEQESAAAPQSSSSKSAQSSHPATTNRAAPLQNILHPVDTTPLLHAAEIHVCSANEADAVQSPRAPTAVPAAVVEEVPDESSANNVNPETESTESPPQNGKRRRRGVFTQKQRDETSQTRTYGACLRCKSQRVRCVPSPLGPYDMCVTCEQVSRNSKKVLHAIRCVRWRLTAMTTYRAGGLDLTKRWEGTEVHNINDWVNEDVKEIDVKLYYSSHMHRYDLCDTPVKFRIREFAPLPDDVCTRKWSKRVEDADGTPRLEKKVVSIPPYALADVDEAEMALDSYFRTNTINAMYDATRHCMPIIREHYDAAIRHYQSFPDGDYEKTFLEKFFRLWFYTRSSYISGGEKLGCEPVRDPDYPMGERISVPRMITAQCDSIMVTKFLKPLSHDLILELEKIFRTGNPDSWFTLYICTFMLLGEVSFSSQDRRRHGTDNWITETPYSLYEFVTDLQFGGNILLCYWHYYRTMDPMDAGWDIFCQVIEPPLSARDKLESAKGKGKKKVHVTTDQRQMVMSHWPKMVELANILSTVHHNKSFEHPLYFVSQMYMREWEIREVYNYTPPGCVKDNQLNVTVRKSM